MRVLNWVNFGCEAASAAVCGDDGGTIRNPCATVDWGAMATFFVGDDDPEVRVMGLAADNVATPFYQQERMPWISILRSGIRK